MAKMNVVTFSKTGHILAAVTRATQPDAPATVEQIAAGGIRMRNATGEKIELTIQERILGVQLVDYKTEVLHRPQQFVLKENGELTQTTSGGDFVTLSGTHVTVTFPSNVSEPTSVWLQISGGNLPEPIICSVTVAAGTSSKSDLLSLASGDYQVAMFAPGFAVKMTKETVP